MARPDHLTTRRLQPAARVVAVLIAVGAATPLAIAATLSPAVQGHGTHEALGLPACGWAVMAGVPCPSCGMTTAFSWAVRGDLLQSAWVQPMGFVLALAAAMTVLAALWAAITGAAVQRPIAAIVMNNWVGWSLLGLLIGAWAWKMATFQGGVVL
jgi:hypothetical protein